MIDFDYRKSKFESLKQYEKKIIDFTEEYFYNKVKKLNIKASLNLITSINDYKFIKILNHAKPMNLNNLGCCDNDNKIEININNYIVKSYITNNYEYNFALLIDTINHELSHAADNYKNKQLTVEDYKIVKFLLLKKLSFNFYLDYYFYLEGEIKAHEIGYKSVIDEFYSNKKFDKIINLNNESLHLTKFLKATETYDIANKNLLDNILLINNNNKFFKENFEYFKYEYNLDGTKKTLEEIINAKDQLKDKNMFYHLAYEALLKEDKIDYNNEIEPILNYGIKCEEERLKINELYASSNFEKNVTKAYLDKRLSNIDKIGKNCR